MSSLILTITTTATTFSNITNKIAKIKGTWIVFTQLEIKGIAVIISIAFCGLAWCDWRWRVRAGPRMKEVHRVRCLGE